MKTVLNMILDILIVITGYLMNWGDPITDPKVQQELEVAIGRAEKLEQALLNKVDLDSIWEWATIAQDEARKYKRKALPIEFYYCQTLSLFSDVDQLQDKAGDQK